MLVMPVQGVMKIQIGILKTLNIMVKREFRVRGNIVIALFRHENLERKKSIKKVEMDGFHPI